MGMVTCPTIGEDHVLLHLGRSHAASDDQFLFFISSLSVSFLYLLLTPKVRARSDVHLSHGGCVSENTIHANSYNSTEASKGQRNTIIIREACFLALDILSLGYLLFRGSCMSTRSSHARKITLLNYICCYVRPLSRWLDEIVCYRAPPNWVQFTDHTRRTCVNVCTLVLYSEMDETTTSFPPISFHTLGNIWMPIGLFFMDEGPYRFIPRTRALPKRTAVCVDFFDESSPRSCPIQDFLIRMEPIHRNYFVIWTSTLPKLCSLSLRRWPHQRQERFRPPIYFHFDVDLINVRTVFS